MNKAIVLATSTLSIAILQFCVFKSKLATAQADNKSIETELAQRTSVEDELEREAPYNDSADTELFYEDGSSIDDENVSGTDNSENSDATVKDELEKEAPYNDSADTELFYEDGASTDDKAEDSKTNRDRTKDNHDNEEFDDKKTNPPQGLNSEDITVDSDLETEAETFDRNASEKPKIEDVRQPDVGEDNLPAEPPVNEAEVRF